MRRQSVDPGAAHRVIPYLLSVACLEGLKHKIPGVPVGRYIGDCGQHGVGQVRRPRPMLRLAPMEGRSSSSQVHVLPGHRNGLADPRADAEREVARRGQVWEGWALKAATHSSVAGCLVLASISNHLTRIGLHQSKEAAWLVAYVGTITCRFRVAPLALG